MRKVLFTSAVMLVSLTGVLAGCSSDVSTPNETPTPVETPVTSDTFNPIDDAENTAVLTDLEATKTRVEAALLAGTPVGSESDLIVNNNPGLFSMTVTDNGDSTFSVTAVNQSTQSVYSITGQGDYSQLKVG